MTLFIVFLFLAIYNTGCMTALQLQHYGIYPLVGREGFAQYMAANNGAAALFSTFRWQRPLQGEMAATGYDEAKIRTLIRTNWIRTLCYWLLSALAISMLLRIVFPTTVVPK